jgi:nucleoid-associated protein YgaU
MATMTIARPMGRAAVSYSAAGASRPNAQQTVRLTRRGRIVVGVVGFLAALVLMVGVTVIGSPALVAADASATQSHTVRAGETLWSIAAASAGSGDVQAVLFEIRRLNDLATSQIVPGQVLQVPTR